jgi:predicted transcriptional regulator
MPDSQMTVTWWDREIDSGGRPIRVDVRLAAHEIWHEACRRTQALTADNAQAADLMERSVTQVSRYLDRRGAPLCSQKMNGLLMLAFSRALQRSVAKLKRLESVGGTNELCNQAIDECWGRQVEARLDLDKMIRRMSERGRTILALRWAGYEWKEIAQLLGTSVAKVRGGFWREIKNARRSLHSKGSGTKGTFKSILVDRPLDHFRFARHPSSWPLAACSRASWPSTRNGSRSSIAFRWAWTPCNRASRVSGSPVLAVVLDQARYRPTSRTAAMQ